MYMGISKSILTAFTSFFAVFDTSAKFNCTTHTHTHTEGERERERERERVGTPGTHTHTEVLLLLVQSITSQPETSPPIATSCIQSPISLQSKGRKAWRVTHGRNPRINTIAISPHYAAHPQLCCYGDMGMRESSPQSHAVCVTAHHFLSLALSPSPSLSLHRE